MKSIYDKMSISIEGISPSKISNKVIDKLILQYAKVNGSFPQYLGMTQVQFGKAGPRLNLSDHPMVNYRNIKICINRRK